MVKMVKRRMMSHLVPAEVTAKVKLATSLARLNGLDDYVLMDHLVGTCLIAMAQEMGHQRVAKALDDLASAIRLEGGRKLN